MAKTLNKAARETQSMAIGTQRPRYHMKLGEAKTKCRQRLTWVWQRFKRSGSAPKPRNTVMPHVAIHLTFR